MTFSFILLGVLLILTIFNVGESIYKKVGIKKQTMLIFLIVTLILYFIPNLKIAGITFSWVGFFLPLVISGIILFKIKKFKIFSKMFVAMLVAFALNIVYCLITFEVYESAILQPYLVLGLILGFACLFWVGTPQRLFASNFLGITFAEVAFYFSRYSIYGDYYLSIGSEKVFAVLLVSFVCSMLSYYLVRKIKVLVIKNKLKKAEREKVV